MSDFRAKVREANDRLEESIADVAIVQAACAKTGWSKLQVVAVAFIVASAILFAGFGARFYTNLVGFVYPAWASFKAVETTTRRDDTAWLTYWVVYALFSTVEVILDSILRWIPLYNAMKLGFLVWLFLPATNGAQVLYAHVVRDLFRHAEDTAAATKTPTAPTKPE